MKIFFNYGRSEPSKNIENHGDIRNKLSFGSILQRGQVSNCETEVINAQRMHTRVTVVCLSVTSLLLVWDVYATKWTYQPIFFAKLWRFSTKGFRYKAFFFHELQVHYLTKLAIFFPQYNNYDIVHVRVLVAGLSASVCVCVSIKLNLAAEWVIIIEHALLKKAHSLVMLPDGLLCSYRKKTSDC